METQSPPASKGIIITGWVLSILPSLLLLMSTTFLLMQSPQVVEGFKKQGYPIGVLLPLGLALGVSVILYLIPTTSVLGAILLTGYLGGAVDSHARLGEMKFIAPVIVAAIIWLGLLLREPRLRSLLPIRR